MIKLSIPAMALMVLLTGCYHTVPQSIRSDGEHKYLETHQTIIHTDGEVKEIKKKY